jgi:Reverse transcriptase (RNA-dependent DNA polymerase)
VDDLIFMGNNHRLIDEFKREMNLEFEMTYLRMMRYFLGLEIRQEKSRIFISQGGYTQEILHKFGMSDCNPIATPMELGAMLSKLEGGEVVDSNTYRSMIGSLRYLTCTRSDITFVVGVANWFMDDQRYPYLKAVKKILRYAKGTEDLGLFYQKTNIFELAGYVDSDWYRDIDDWKRISGYVLYMEGTTFTWLSKKQHIVTLSICEAEYVAASLDVSYAIWLRRLPQELKCPQLESTELQVDNMSAIELAKNPVHHERSKHIVVRFHSIREHIKDGKVRVIHVQSNDQAADIFTKALPKPLFKNCKQMLEMMKERDLSLREDVESSKLQVSIPKDQEHGTRPHQDASCRTQKSSSSIKHERVPKAMLWMDQSLIAQEYQGARDEALAPMMNGILLTSVACVRDNWWEQQ